MRSLISTLLTAVLLACPLVCGADQDGCGVGRGHEAGGLGAAPSDGSDHCPASGDDCVCRGAVQSGEGRTFVPGADASAPLVFFALPPLVVHPLHHLTWQGSPTGLAGWGDSLTIRALLQNFRC